MNVTTLEIQTIVLGKVLFGTLNYGIEFDGKQYRPVLLLFTFPALSIQSLQLPASSPRPQRPLLTLGAHAQRGLVVVYTCARTCASVCLSASYLTAINRSTNDITYSASDKKICGCFLWNCCVRELRRAKRQQCLSRAGPLARCILKAQEVTAKGVYRLPHAIYCCS